MTNAIEITNENETEYTTLVNTNFTLLPYELEKYTQAGWAVNQQSYPTFDFVTYEVHLYRNATTVARAKERMKGGAEGRPVVTKEMKQESMRKAQEKLAEKRAEAKKAVGKA